VGAANRYRALLDQVISRQAALIAKWQLVGFIHGVMNTDNMSIAGETIDYGPCAFMDLYHPRTVYSSIDQKGRYAYGNQPQIAQWNLVRLAETLLPLLAEDNDAGVKEAQEAIDEFAKAFETAYAAGLSRKLGLFRPRPDDLSLAQDLFEQSAPLRAMRARSNLCRGRLVRRSRAPPAASWGLCRAIRLGRRRAMRGRAHPRSMPVSSPICSAP
jgi:uncharacterized protein YdiU (UPF0061 family)